jgi:2-(1,2-epoxy-1,2-dihydrophenyl)acetyl-CoA isomerase
VPDSGLTWLLPRLVGGAKAAELALLGEPLAASDAARIGLVARVVPAEQVVAEAQDIAGRLAAGSPRAIALTKDALERSWSSTWEEQLELEARLQGEAGAADDHAEGLAAFLDKRPPRFSGE